MDVRPYSEIPARNQAFEEVKFMCRVFARKHSIPGLETEDLEQDLALHLLHQVIPTYESARGDFYVFCWCCLQKRIGAHFVKVYRRAARVKDIYTNVIPAMFENVEDVGARIEDADILSRIAAKKIAPGVVHYLSAHQRRCVMLFAVCELTYEEIAKELGVGRKSVDNALVRARQRALVYMETNSE